MEISQTGPAAAAAMKMATATAGRISLPIGGDEMRAELAATGSIVAGHIACAGEAGGSRPATLAEANDTVTTHRKLADAPMQAAFQSNDGRMRDMVLPAGRNLVSPY